MTAPTEAPAPAGRTGDRGPRNENAPVREERAEAREESGQASRRADYTAPDYPPAWRHREAFQDAITAAGLGRPEIEPDGEVHRFQVEGDRPASRNGWYVLHLDGRPAGTFGSWKDPDARQIWRADSDRAPSAEDQERLRAMAEQARAARQAETERKHAKARTKAAAEWGAASEAGAELHPYLIAKRVAAHGLRMADGLLLVPVRDAAGEMHGLQRIGPDGAKRFLSGGAIGGHFHLLGEPTAGKPLYIAEGYATGATIHEATGAPVAVAFNCSNLLPVARVLRDTYPTAALIVAGDNDAWTTGNPGARHAKEAAEATGAALVLPHFQEFDQSDRPTDFNDLARLGGLEAVRAQLEAAELPGDARAQREKLLNDVQDVQDVQPSRLDAALTVAAESVTRCKEDPGILASPAFLAAAALIRQKSPEDWIRLRAAIKTAKPDGVLLKDIDRAASPDHGPPDDSSIADELVDLVQGRAALFHAPDGTCYAGLNGEQVPKVTLRLDTQAFADWLSFAYYDATKTAERPGRAASETAIRTARVALTGLARHEGPERPVYLRAAKKDGAYYIDLGTASAETVEVTAAGWRVIAAPPVSFWRPSTMRPLPMPIPGGELARLWRSANIPQAERPLVVAWLLASWCPETPFAVLELTGQQGTAKSFTQAKLRRCIDPNAVDLRAAPKAVEDLFVSAGANWVASLNNLSHLSGPLQDALCTLATGGGFAARTLYTNADETLIEAKRPVMLNGIVPVVTTQDLTDRVIHIELPELTTYRTETALDADFEKDAPHIVGGLLDLFVKTLAALPGVTLERPPRMADYAALGEAMLRAQGERPGAFLDLYHANRRDSVARSLESSPVACAIRRLVEEYPPSAPALVWSGTMGGLLDKLAALRDGAEAWPKSARGLGEALRRQRPALAQIGISVEIGKAGEHGVPVWIRRKAEHPERPERHLEVFCPARACQSAPDRAEVEL